MATKVPAPARRRRVGRPTLDVKPTMVRLGQDVRRRIVALVGKNRMAAFIREAVENELRQREKIHADQADGDTVLEKRDRPESKSPE